MEKRHFNAAHYQEPVNKENEGTAPHTQYNFTDKASSRKKALIPATLLSARKQQSLTLHSSFFPLLF
ncbi:MAG: hypothetical protein KJ804_02570 [Proteobacteria bacterium]|nr:hypothetical protein [Pseudomonadota bacterium]MBU1057189.1 hypothetical protein [Pseudomonadota bacterium]